MKVEHTGIHKLCMYLHKKKSYITLSIPEYLVYVYVRHRLSFIPVYKRGSPYTNGDPRLQTGSPFVHGDQFTLIPVYHLSPFTNRVTVYKRGP